MSKDISFGAAVVGDAEVAAVRRVLESGRLTRGPVCEEMEADLARLTGLEAHVVSSGTAAMHLALLAAGVQPGDRVIVPATTYVATLNAVLYCGAEPVLVDVCPATWTIDFDEAVEEAESRQAAAIVPVHLYGVPAPSFHGWREDYFRRTGRLVRIVEDAAESLGCLRSGRHPCGDLAALSFFGSKTITTGEGGAVLWRDPTLGARVRHLAGQAMTKQRYRHDTVGFNYRMTELQAAIGVEQLKKLPALLDARRHVFAWYDEFLPAGWRRQDIDRNDTHGLWAYAATNNELDARRVIHGMAQAGIECRPIFPPLGRHNHAERFAAYTPLADFLHDRGIVLPTHPLLTRDDVSRVCETLAEWK